MALPDFPGDVVVIDVRPGDEFEATDAVRLLRDQGINALQMRDGVVERNS